MGKYNINRLSFKFRRIKKKFGPDFVLMSESNFDFAPETDKKSVFT